MDCKSPVCYPFYQARVIRHNFIYRLINVDFNRVCVIGIIRVVVASSFKNADPSSEKLVLYACRLPLILYRDYNWCVGMDYYRRIYSDHLWMRNCYIPSYP